MSNLMSLEISKLLFLQQLEFKQRSTDRYVRQRGGKACSLGQLSPHREDDAKGYQDLGRWQWMGKHSVTSWDHYSWKSPSSLSTVQTQHVLRAWKLQQVYSLFRKRLIFTSTQTKQCGTDKRSSLLLRHGEGSMSRIMSSSKGMAIRQCVVNVNDI